MRSITNMVAVWLAGAAIGSPYVADATTAKTLAEDLVSMTPKQTASGGAVIRDNSWTSMGARKTHSSQVQPEFALTSCASFAAEGTGFDVGDFRNVSLTRPLR